MSYEYFLFFHGVRVIDSTFADTLAYSVGNKLGKGYVVHADALSYYQTVHSVESDLLMNALNTSSIWKNFWYTPIRADVIIPFLGDAVLYFNSEVGAKLIKLLRGKIEEIEMKAVASKEVVYFHITGHSLGSVIIFDILFGPRWDVSIGNLPSEAFNDVQYIRDHLKPVLKDLGEEQEPGIKLANIITMGSPIAIFGLMEAVLSPDVANPRIINIFLKRHRDTNVSFPWHNLYYPGDPIAYPVGPIIGNLLQKNWDGKLDLPIVSNESAIDVPVPAANWQEKVVNWVFSRLPYIQILYGANYHGSGYFRENEKLAEVIAGYVRAVHK